MFSFFIPTHRLLESSIESEERLWSIARVMSEEEFLAASEERCLAGMCGNALCSKPMPEIESKGNFQIDAIEKKVYAMVEGPGYCGVDCAAASKGFAHRLGGGGQAMHRFERLMEQLREKKRKQRLEAEKASEQHQVTTQEDLQQESTTSTSAATETTPPVGETNSTTAAAQPTKPKGVLKKSDLAAGSVKIPIMTAEVKERDPSAAGAEPPKAPSARKTHAVEGYVPKAVLKQHRKERKEGRRVRFSDAADDTSDTVHVEASKGCEINPTGDDLWEGEEESLKQSEIQQDQHEENEEVEPLLAATTQPAVFVLDVEDAESPIEGAEHALSSKFGRLRVANEIEVQEAGLPVDGSTLTTIISGDTHAATHAETTKATKTGEEEEQQPSIDEILAQRLRQGASKYFPQLAATLPLELAKALEDSASEAASSDAGDESGVEEEWMLSDTESDEDNNDDGENFGTNTTNGGKFRSRPTLFGELVTNLDAWVTDSTVLLLQSSPEDGTNRTFLNSTFDSVPEIETALSRFIAFALPPVMEKLVVGMPKGEVERNLMELIKTFHLVSALPAFMSSQWQLVVLMFLKALSMERVPGLRPVFETREGVHRVNQILTANLFTIEEFVAVLEILLEQ
jgi:hypothetical protein